jgi:hypothetical protein
MTRKHCRQRIMQLWSEFALNPRNASLPEMQGFYLWLLVQHRDLVMWLTPSRGDRWEEVRAWILELQGGVRTASNGSMAPA